MAQNFFKVRNGVNVGVLTADPSGGTEGDMYYNSTTSKLREYINGAWRSAVDETSTQTLSNKSFDNTTSSTVKDANFTIQDDVDTTKQLKFQASGITTGTTRTLTAPDNSGVILTDTSTASVSNKTLDNTNVANIKDTNLTIQDDGDTSKQAKFDASGITTATTRTFGLPDVSSNLLARTSTDQGANRVTNKDLEAGSTKIVDATDTTKKIAFQASGATTGTTLTITESQSTSQSLAIPNVASGDTIATNNTTATLASKQIQYSSSTNSTTTGSSQTLAAFTTGVVRLTNASLVSVSGIPAGSSGQVLIIENKTGNQITLNNEDTGTTAANRLLTGSGTNVQMATNATFQFSYDSTSSRWQLVGGTGSGSGSGVKNYLTAYTASTASGVANIGNGNIESGSTAGWSLFNTTLTGVLPTGGISAGAGSISTFQANNTTNISGLYSLQISSSALTAGQGFISDAFFIDQSDQAKAMTFNFNYNPYLVPATENFSGTSSNTWAVYIYDVTNSAWIQPAGVYSMTQGFGVGKASGTFQTTSNSTQYRLAVLCINATASTTGNMFDDFFVGPQITNQGPAVDDYVAYTPVFAGLGTVTGSAIFSRRNGDRLEVRGRVQTGTVTGTTVTMTLGYKGISGGLNIDTNKLASSEVVGQLNINLAPANYFGWSVVADVASSTNTVGFGIQTTATAATGRVSGSNLTNSTNNVVLEMNFSIPIAGWSSNLSLSNDTDTRVVDLVLNKNGTQSIATGDVQITSVTVAKDSHGSFDSGNNYYVVPVSGDYIVQSAFSHIPSGGQTSGFGVTINGGAVNRASIVLGSAAGTNIIPGSQMLFGLKAGDLMRFFAFNNAGTTVIQGSTNIFVSRISGPSVVAASESIAAQYNSQAASNITNNILTYIDFNIKETDTHSAVAGAGSGNVTTSGTGWRFIVPVSGHYHIDAVISYTTGTISNPAGSGVWMAIHKNGTRTMNGPRYDGASLGAAGYRALTVSGVLYCVAGDRIELGAIQNDGGATRTMDGAATNNRVCIFRIGN